MKDKFLKELDKAEKLGKLTGVSKCTKDRLAERYTKNKIYPVDGFDFEVWCKFQRIYYNRKTIITDFGNEVDYFLFDYYLTVMEMYFDYVENYVQNDIDDEDTSLFDCEEFFDSCYDNAGEKED